MKQTLRFVSVFLLLCFVVTIQSNAQCTPVGNPTVFGQNVWNVYAWNAGGGTLSNNNAWSTNYAGYYVDTELNFNTQNRWAKDASPSSASGYQGCPVAEDYHSWSAKRKGFPCGHYKIYRPNYEDAVQLFIDGKEVWAGLSYLYLWTDIVWEGELGQNSEIEFRCTEGWGDSYGDVYFLHDQQPVITAGGYTALCSGESLVLTASAGNDYLWSTGETTQSITVSKSGNYTVKGTASCGDEIESDPVAITVASMPKPTIIPNGNPACSDVPSFSVTNYQADQGFVFNWYKVGVANPILIESNNFNAVADGDYYVIVSRPGCASSPASDLVHAIIKPDPSIFGDNQWNVYYYQSGSYMGYYKEPLLSFNTWNRWEPDYGPPGAVGYVGCDYSYYENGQFNAKRKGFPCGRYSIDIPAHYDDAILYINGLMMWEQAGIGSGSNIWEGYLGPESEVEFVVTRYTALLAGAITFNLINADIVAKPTITPAGPVNICSLDNLTLTSSASAGNTWSTGETTQSINVNTAGSYYATVTGAEGCTAQSDPVNVTVTQAQTFYLDADGDNFGDPAITRLACSAPDGYVTDGTDCNDANAAINPGATEVCNGIDDDCDGSIDEGVTAAPTGSLTIVNSSCQSNCTVTGGSIAIGSVSANGVGTLEYSINNGASWSSTLPTYNQTSSFTILASVVDGGGCRSSSFAVGTTVPGSCPPDGINWTARTAAEANFWYSVTYGNGLFVAVALGSNRVMTSPDGITWTARPAAAASDWYSVTYGNGLFVAVASSGTNRVMTSPDGITWTARTAAAANQWTSVTYGNGLFVAVAFDGTNRVMTSPDGITWTARTAAEANQWYSVTYGNGLFVAVAISGTNRVMTSPDGITWTARIAAAVNNWRSVTYGNGLFVAVASTGTNRVMTSPDGITWTARTAVAANFWSSVTYGNGQFVAVAASGTDRVMTSADGLPATWYLDADNDNYYTGSGVTQCTSPGVGYKTTGLIGGGDCDDANAAINPGATEVCGDGKDNNCNGQIDEGCNILRTWYRDVDGDGYGKPNLSRRSITQPRGFVDNANDCNDEDAKVYPGAEELPDGKDNDCDGQIDEGLGCRVVWYRDVDGDGFGKPNLTRRSCVQPRGFVNNANDCNDEDAKVYPGAEELEDGIDNDCDGQIDEGLECRVVWYRDVDGDGFGKPNLTIRSCVQPRGYVDNALDCRDNDPTVNPGATEVCGNGKDDDCNGIVDDGCGQITTTLSSKPGSAVQNLSKGDGTMIPALGVNLWPNPASTTLMVTLDEFVPNQKLELSLMQADGKVQTALSLIPTMHGQQVRMDVSRMAAGYYLLLAKQQGMVVSKRVVILR